MAWIESHDELPTHPKTLKAARRLNVGAPQVIGHLHFLWYWCLTHAPDGRLEGMDADDVADAAGWTGEGEAFVKALVVSGWLDDDAGMLVVHDWWEGAGKTIKRRRFATERQRRARDSQTDHGPVTDESPDSHDDVTRDKRVSHGADSDSDSDKPQETTSPPVGVDPEVSDEARRLTRVFALAVKANGHPVPKADTTAQQSWLVGMDRLLRIGPPGWDGDPPTPAEVEQVIGWVTSDDFEKPNVASVPKFRKRYSALRLKAINATGPKGPTRPPTGDVDYTAGWGRREDAS